MKQLPKNLENKLISVSNELENGLNNVDIKELLYQFTIEILNESRNIAREEIRRRCISNNKVNVNPHIKVRKNPDQIDKEIKLARENIENYVILSEEELKDRARPDYRPKGLRVQEY